jgi:hypothetical protein
MISLILLKDLDDTISMTQSKVTNND